ncbi:sigma-70 family RNA polymerase sigma factor [Saccharophagus degradans]|uniref:Sigma-70 family RNA polymerase sigma factor n=1 Tax=Saccharophagus degradans TaxID=86304 RepID=A0AAW7X5W9_9GAMM|nr:sigma-70 family RNA polymerase sigma factor [Saccharophagus degradans]MBU2986786.1 sigma-70 family RNA polymerase sigma factor [Saccharophagus degradans]MDO6422784.1 sigma-70 family RNA polymerase sigma factor [Saccharophagus degradans]MDO6606257.1 sigma-70 family RNA polymerase sigma factor [Saccharophagus degradans]WGO98462.1 sigma-70 family RNA polymerase sigma factor [Saccharophagus degradans]
MKHDSEQILNEWLVAAAQAGDSAALQRLIARWQPRLLSYSVSQLQDREAAQDVVQEVMLQITKKLMQLQDPAAFPKWAYQILQRRGIDWIRRKQTRRKYEQPMPDDESHVELGGTTTPDHAQNISLQQALHSLEPEAQQIIRLFYMEGFSVQEIGSIIDKPEGTVKSRLFAARNKLKQVLEGGHND